MLRAVPSLDVRDLLVEERAELVTLLRALTPEEATAPTICMPWTVRDVAAHVLGDDLSLLARLRDGFADPSVPEPPRSWDGLLAWLDRRNEAWVEASAFLSLELLADLLERVGGLTAEFFGSLDLGAPGDVVEWVGDEPAPMWLNIGREFTERWVHQQQIRDAVKKPGLNGPRFVGPILAILMRSLPKAYRDVAADEGTLVAIIVDGRAGRPWLLRRDADAWALYEGREQEVAATITVDQDVAWRFLVRAIPRKEAEPKVIMTGDHDLARPFFEAVAAVVRD